jgi:hypothetical protein
MTLTVFLFIVFIAFIVYQIAVAVLNTRVINRMRDIRYRAETQHSLGMARQGLMRLMVEKQLSSDSITFLNFYMMSTAIMRHPDRYNEIARMLQESLILGFRGENDSDSVADSIVTESKTWSYDVKKVVTQIDEALTLLMVYHSPLLSSARTVAVAFHRILAHRLRRQFGSIISISRLIAKRDPDTRMIVQAKSRLEALAA